MFKIFDKLKSPKSRLKEAFVARVKNGKSFNHFHTYTILGRGIQVLRTDFLAARHGASSADFTVADKNYPNNKIRTDNTQGNIGHETLIFPNGEFYNYSHKEFGDDHWTSPSCINYDMLEYLIKNSDIPLDKRYKLLESSKSQGEEYSLIYAKNHKKIKKQMEINFPEYLI